MIQSVDSENGRAKQAYDDAIRMLSQDPTSLYVQHVSVSSFKYIVLKLFFYLILDYLFVMLVHYKLSNGNLNLNKEILL